MNEQLKIIGIQGVNATGKSTLSHRLLKDFIDYDLVATDNIVALNRKSNPDDSRIKYSSYSSWKRFGEPTKENIWKGFLEYRESNKEYLNCLLDRAKEQKVGMIIEGVHIEPESFYKYNKYLGVNIFLLYLTDEKMHKERIKQKCSYRPELLKDLDNFFPYIRTLQDLLLEEAENYNIKVIEVGTNISESLKKIRKSIK